MKMRSTSCRSKSGWWNLDIPLFKEKMRWCGLIASGGIHLSGPSPVDDV
jgi:hypothetical protein